MIRFVAVLIIGVLAQGLEAFAGADEGTMPGEMAVKLISPPDGAEFPDPTDIRLVAVVEAGNAGRVSVEFFDGDISVGAVESASLGAMDAWYREWKWFALNWEQAPVGSHLLTAVATGAGGVSVRSQPVQIRVIEIPERIIVDVKATDPSGAEADSVLTSPNTATFTVGRSGPTDRPLKVFFELDGSAQNGVDYHQISSPITISEGRSSTEVVIVPIDDREVEGDEWVVLKIIPPICTEQWPPPPECYLPGRCQVARAVIHDNDDELNDPPAVRLVAPQDGQVFRAPADLILAASAFDLDGDVKQVEFFEGDRSLGIATLPDPRPLLYQDADDRHYSPYPLYLLRWNDVPAGSYVLTAEATDNLGATGLSKPVEIKVVERTPPPIVMVEAIDPEAAEPHPIASSALVDTATFLVTRTGPTDDPLTVYYKLEGAAKNGIDYRELSGKLEIPVDASTAEVRVVPLDDDVYEGPEWVALHLAPPTCIAVYPPPRDCYRVGQPGAARAWIADNDPPAPFPPEVNIKTIRGETMEPIPGSLAPLRPAILRVSRSGPIGAALTVNYAVGGTAENGEDYDGLSGSVEIREGDEFADVYIIPLDDDIHEGTESVVVRLKPDDCLQIVPPPLGCYVVGPLNEAGVRILDNDPLPNQPPRVRIGEPSSGEVFKEGTTIDILAKTIDPDGWVRKMEFFADGSLIGEREIAFVVEPLPGMEQVFSFPWEHAPAGFHRLFVGATDNLGLSTRSEPVLIHVRPGPDIPIVNIFAPDPLAAEDGSPGRPANPALFRVRRSGPTAAPLVVDYEIGGTAENGADYRRISGQVTLLAGRHSAGIEIVPIDDDLSEFAETVVLKLFVAVDSDPPPYQVGRFSKAAAVIVDRDQPWPHCRSLPDGLVHLCRPLIPSGILQVEAAPDPLGEWEPVGILTASEEAIHFVDAETPDWPTRCYRFVSVTANPVAVED